MLPPREDLHFLLFDWLHAENLVEQPAFAHVDRDSAEAMARRAGDRLRMQRNQIAIRQFSVMAK